MRIRNTSTSGQAFSGPAASGMVTPFGTPTVAPYGPAGQAAYSFTAGSSFEEIRDVNDNPRKSNPVEHRSYSLVYEPPVGDYYFPFAGENINGTISTGYATIAVSSIWTWYLKGVYSLDSLSQSSFGTDYPAVPHAAPTFALTDDLSSVQRLVKKATDPVADHLLNVSEANQLLPTLRSFAPGFGVAKLRWASFQEALRSARRLARLAGRRFSGAYLAYQFGIAPLLNDLSATQSFLSYIKKDFEAFRAEKPSRTSISMRGNVNLSPVTLYSVSAGSLKIREARISHRADVYPVTRYVCRYALKQPYHSSVFQKADYLLRRFSTDPLSFAWEKIPFSFVVDWFVDVSGFLSTLATLTSQRYKFFEITKSRSYDLVGDLEYLVRDARNSSTVFQASYGTTHSRYYGRSVLSASDALQLRLADRFGKKQGRLSAALLLQKILKTKR